MQGVVEALTSAYPRLSKKLQAAAKFAIDNPERMAFGSMRSVASECGVSTPTMLRLARQLGHDSYESFKETFRDVVVSGSFSSRAHLLFEIADGRDGSLIADLGRTALKNIRAAIAQNSEDTFRTMATILREARTTHLVAGGSMYWLAAHMENTGSIAIDGLRVTRLGVATVVETLTDLRPQDAVLAIAISPYAVSTVEAARYAMESGVRVMALTDKRSSPLTANSHYCLYAPTVSAHYYPSIIGVAMLAEALLSYATAKNRKDALERFDQFEKLRMRSGAYIA